MRIDRIGEHAPGRMHGYFLHGIFNRGDSAVLPLARALAGDLNCWSVDYGWISPVGALLGNRRRAKHFATQLRWPTILVGHSNACAMISRVVDALPVERRACIEWLVLINPALDTRWEPPEGMGMLVFHNRGDWPVQATRPLSVWPLRHLHRWGGMGAVGPRAVRDDIIGVDTSVHGHTGHGAVLKRPDYYARIIREL